MKKKLWTAFHCISFFVISTISYSQDIIFLRNGQEIEAKVIEILPNLIKYNKWTNQNGPMYSIDKSEVFMIKYTDGSKDVFQEENIAKTTNSIDFSEETKKEQALMKVKAYVLNQLKETPLQLIEFRKTNGYSANTFEGNIYTIYIEVKACLKSKGWLIGNGLVGYWHNSFHVYKTEPRLNSYQVMTDNVKSYPRGMKFIFTCEVKTLEMDNGYGIKEFKIQKVIEDGIISNIPSGFGVENESADKYVPLKGELTLTTEESLYAISDVEGNLYRTVIIGSQTWMKDNLRVTHYNDGSSLSMKTDSEIIFGSYCWPQNDVEYKNIWGALYDGRAVHSKKLCPVGWHVPNESEWAELFNFIGGTNIAGGKLKNKSYWYISDNSIQISHYDEYGFNAIPSGYKSLYTFQPMGMTSVFWTSTKSDNDVICVMLEKGSDSVLWLYQNFDQSLLSVRCIKDNQEDAIQTNR